MAHDASSPPVARYPFEVFWLTDGGGGGQHEKGRLCLAPAPGRNAHATPGPGHVRDLGEDLDRAAQRFGIRVLVCLLQDYELAFLGIAALVAESNKRGMDVRRFPCSDGRAPASIAAVSVVAIEIRGALDAGRNVMVHCRAGLGRSGVIAACALITLGSSASGALDILRARRGPRCPETDDQIRFVHSFASEMNC